MKLVHCGLPDEAERIDFINKFLNPIKRPITKDVLDAGQIAEIASKTEKFSIGNIQDIFVSTIKEAIKDAVKKGEEPKLTYDLIIKYINKIRK